MHHYDWLSIKSTAYCILVWVTNRASETSYSLAAYPVVLVLTHVDLACSWSLGQTAVGLSERSAIS